MNLSRKLLILLFPLLISSQAYAETKIIVVGKDNDGWASGKAYLQKEKVWTEAGIEKRKFESFSDRSLSDGTATFSVPPGKYKVVVYYSETSGSSPSQESEEFLVADKDEASKEFYFEKGKVNVVGKDNDGWASGKAYLQKEKVWTEAGIEKRKFESFSDRSLSDGTATFSVPPGKYKVVVYYSETSGSSPSQESDEFLVADKDEASKEFYFEKGKVNVVGKDNDGWASGKAYLQKEKVWTEAGIEKRKFESFSDRSLSDGTATFSVPPGIYKFTVYHNNRKAYPSNLEGTIVCLDLDEITISADFSGGSTSIKGASTHRKDTIKQNHSANNQIHYKQKDETSNSRNENAQQELQDAAVKYGLDMMNPLKSSDDVDKSFDELKESAEKAFNSK